MQLGGVRARSRDPRWCPWCRRGASVATSSTTCSTQTSRNSGHSPSSPDLDQPRLEGVVLVVGDLCLRMMSCTALRTSRATRSTRSGGCADARRPACLEEALVALAPDAAALAVSVTVVGVSGSCGPPWVWWGSDRIWLLVAGGSALSLSSSISTPRPAPCRTGELAVLDRRAVRSAGRRSCRGSWTARRPGGR